MSTVVKRTLVAGIIIVALVVLGFTVWVARGLGPGEAAERALIPGERVHVHERRGDWFVFTPVANGEGPAGESWDVAPLRQLGSLDRGIIIYPGGRVDARSYAPLARRFAERGFPVIVVEAPLNLMILAADRVATIAGVYPEVEQWTLIGHSLGAAAAARLVDQAEPVELSTYGIDSLVLLAGYPASGWDISDKPVSVLSIAAEHDEVLDREAWERARSLLPDDTEFYEIAGGNHAGFADYGVQRGDGEASISSAEQMDRTVERVLSFIE